MEIWSEMCKFKKFTDYVGRTVGLRHDTGIKSTLTMHLNVYELSLHYAE